MKQGVEAIMERVIDGILAGIAGRIEEITSQNCFSSEWIEKRRYLKDNRLHVGMLGVISNVCSQLGYLLGPGEKLYMNEKAQPYRQRGREYRSLKPDFTLWEGSALEGIIEYETMNSSDYRIITRDLKRYSVSTKHGLVEIRQPMFWLIITTLPNKEIKKKDRWFTWSYDGHLSGEERENVFRNPYEYYYSKWLPEFRKIEKGFTSITQLYLANLTEDNGLRLEYPIRRRYTINWGKN